MAATVTFFPVDNGDMTLIKLESGKTILIDANIRSAADDSNDSTRDVGKDLRDRLSRDSEGRMYVDVFLLSHPDKDHCTGLEKHFHLGELKNHSGDKIVIREIWSSPMIFRRASSNHTLCDDAKKFNTEAKRRVARNKESGFSVGDGDRILILGKDENGKTDDLSEILIEVDQRIDKVNGQYDQGIDALLLAPLPKSDDDDEEATLSKNHSSVVMNFTIKAAGGSCQFLTGGDAEVAIWERLWNKHKDQTDNLRYNLLQAPHHCSWHSLSYDSWSEKGEEAEVNQEARNALGQAESGAHIVASSKAVKNDDSDPPCIRAKREYEKILKPVSGLFKCTGEYPKESAPAPMEFEIGRMGLSLKSVALGATAAKGSSSIGKEPLPHG